VNYPKFNNFLQRIEPDFTQVKIHVAILIKEIEVEMLCFMMKSCLKFVIFPLPNIVTATNKIMPLHL